MNILYIYAHPYAHSFNSLLKEEGLKALKITKHNVIVSDLYAEKFNAIASLKDFIVRLISYDLIMC